MSELVAKLFGRSFLALANLPAVNHQIVLVGDAINADGAEGKVFELHLNLRVCRN
ncbi:MAG TPA: hypothetical protein VEV41_17630 [Terriglobales bacterium]|nr:hypothetical protein [Terriglobales bacterium]